MAGGNTRYQAKAAATLAIVSSTAAAVFVTAADSTKPCIVYFPVITAKSALFCVRAWGRFTTGTSGTALATLQYGTSVTASSNTDIAALGANTVATNGNWNIATELAWDSTSKILRGSMWGTSGDTPTILGLVVNTATKSSVDLSLSGLGIVCSATFGTSNASNVAFLDGLTMEVL